METSGKKIPEVYISRLAGDPKPETLRSLRSTLRNEDEDWVTTFIDLGGIESLVDILTLKNKKSG